MMGNAGGFSGFPGYAVRDRRWWTRPEESAQEPAREEPAEAPRPSPVAPLEAELAERDRLLREAQARERQAVAELDQARARLERDARREIDRARRDLIVSLLPVLDDLDRAIASAQSGRAGDPLLVGVEHVRSGFLDRLRALGVERFDPAGEPFDPAVHEAMAAVDRPSVDGGVRVVETLRAGYRSGQDVVRPAQVVVTRRSPEQARAAAAYLQGHD